MRVELTPKALGQIDHVCHRQGMTQLSVLSRLVNWVASQPDEVQAAVLGQYSWASDAQITKFILRHLSGEKDAIQDLAVAAGEKG